MDVRRITLEQVCRKFAISILYAFGSQAKRLRDWIEENEDHLYMQTVKTGKVSLKATSNNLTFES